MRLSRFVLSVLAVAASPCLAQVHPLQLPNGSPKATVAQKVGLTDVTVRYSRPAVNGRKMWGGLVPFGEVWRTGADENTTQLRGLPRFGWQGWNGAAAWCLKNDTALDQAEEWADRSIQMNRNFTNQSTKASLREKTGDAKAAAELREGALATEPELNQYGYQLLGQKKGGRGDPRLREEHEGPSRLVERLGLARRRLGHGGRQEEGHRHLREGALDDRGRGAEEENPRRAGEAQAVARGL